VPKGSERIDQESNPKLTIMPLMVITLGHSREKPCDCFIAVAQTISNKPARTRDIHATAASFGCRAVPVLIP
jgi:hypothetical protein